MRVDTIDLLRRYTLIIYEIDRRLKISNVWYKSTSSLG